MTTEHTDVTIPGAAQASGPREIWLAPKCEEDNPEGRYWREDEPETCPECGELPVRYVRADLALSGNGEAEPVAVKPLEWRKGRPDWYADSVIGQYACGYIGSKISVILRCVVDGQDKDITIGRGTTYEEAKSVAQADYEQRIRSALVAPPAEPARAELVGRLTQTPLIEGLTPSNYEWGACETVADRYELMKRKIREAFAAITPPAAAKDDTSQREGEELAHRIQDTIDAWAKTELADYPESEGGITSWSDRIATAVVAAHYHSLEAEPVQSGEAFCWVPPGDDTANMNGFIDAMAWKEGEFTKPLYAHPAARAIEELRAADRVHLSAKLGADKRLTDRIMSLEAEIAALTPDAKDKRIAELEAELDEAKDTAVNFVFDALALALGLNGWVGEDGSETWNGDVRATLMRILRDSGAIDPETDTLAADRAEAAEAQLAALTDKSGNAELIVGLKEVLGYPLIRRGTRGRRITRLISDAIAALSRSPARMGETIKARSDLYVGMAIAAGMIAAMNDVEAEEILHACGMTTVEELMAAGVDDYDIDKLKPVLAHIANKQETKRLHLSALNKEEGE